MSAPLAGDWQPLYLAQKTLDRAGDDLIAAVYQLRSYQMDNNQVDDATVAVYRRGMERHYGRFMQASGTVSGIKQWMAQRYQDQETQP